MYPPHSFGGYELVWRAAVEHLRGRGHDVRVLTTDTRTGTAEPDDPGVHRELRWHLRDGEFEQLGPRAAVAMARHNHDVLERHLAEQRPDVVSWWSMGGLTLTMLETVRRRALPAVAFVHDEWLGYGPEVDPWLRAVAPRRPRLRRLAERLAGLPGRVGFAEAATYVFVSEEMRRHAQGLGLGLRRTAVAHSGIDPAFLAAAAPEREWAWRLLYVGRLDPRKGIGTRPDKDVPECVSQALDRLQDCAFLRGKALEGPRINVLATEEVEGASLIDPTPMVCPGETCPAVIGDVLVYRNGAHLTRTYVNTLTPWLGEQLPEPAG